MKKAGKLFLFFTMVLTFIFFSSCDGFWSGFLGMEDRNPLFSLFGGDQYDTFVKALELPNGNFLLIGISNSASIDGVSNNGNTDIYLVCISQTGERLWHKFYGGSDNDYVYDALLLKNNTILLAGGTESSKYGVTAPNEGALLLNIDMQGNELWYKVHGFSGYQEIRSIVCEGENLYILAYAVSGDLNPGGFSKYVALKTDLSGKLLWNFIYGGDGDDEPTKILMNSEGEILLIGNSLSTVFGSESNHGSDDILIIKIDRSGNLLHGKMIGGSQSDMVADACIGESGDLLIFGTSNSSELAGQFDSSINAGLFILDDSFNIKIQRFYGGSAVDRPVSVFVDSDSNIWLLATTLSSDIEDFIYGGSLAVYSAPSYDDIYILKLNKYYVPVMNKIFGSSEVDQSPHVIQINFRDFFLFGETFGEIISGYPVNGQSDYFVMTINENGDYE